jgi:(p)ppGpp synthase/HD superfamily hydrolase
MSNLYRAIKIAAQAHAGQFDRGGEPYILHPLRVMVRCKTDEERTVAILHDVVEDCPDWPLERLAAEGFSPAVLSGIDAVTKRDGEDYDAFIERAGRDPIGRVVKIEDLTDNMDLRRLPRTITDRDLARQAKYARALAALNQGVVH